MATLPLTVVLHLHHQRLGFSSRLCLAEGCVNAFSVGMRESWDAGQPWNGKVCVMQKEFQASFWLILFFRVLLMWLDGNLHVECSLSFLEYF